MTREDESLENTLEAVQEVPPRVVVAYTRLWQLETWLRQMVYIELKAAFGSNWKQHVPQPGMSLADDLRLTHMPTAEESPISYVTFGSLQKIIENNWNLFSVYLPPPDLWSAKLVEVSQIRNRVAHFRIGNSDDLERVLRFMRDIDQGFWRFCTSYNDSFPVLPPSKDPVVNRFKLLNQFPYVKIGAKKWAMAGAANPTAVFNMAINVLQRPWHANRPTGRISGQPGFLYDIVIVGRDGRSFDYARFLQDTKRLHEDLVHARLDAFNSSVRLTIPGLLGTRTVNATIQGIVDWVPNSLRRAVDVVDQSEKVQRLADQWPEYVLGPKNPLCFLSPDMPCSFFTV